MRLKAKIKRLSKTNIIENYIDQEFWDKRQQCDSSIWFYGISTIVGYLKPNPVFTYVFCRYIKLNYQTVLFLTIQFSISQMVPSIAIYNKQYN